jgi:hypothetical protein
MDDKLVQAAMGERVEFRDRCAIGDLVTER